MRLAYLHAEVIDGDGQVVQHQVDAVVVVNLVLEVLGPDTSSSSGKPATSTGGHVRRRHGVHHLLWLHGIVSGCGCRAHWDCLAHETW